MPPINISTVSKNKLFERIKWIVRETYIVYMIWGRVKIGIKQKQQQQQQHRVKFLEHLFGLWVFVCAIISQELAEKNLHWGQHLLPLATE